jgi:hypothetical protein
VTISERIEAGRRDLISRLARCLDSRDFDSLRDLFSADATVRANLVASFAGRSGDLLRRRGENTCSSRAEVSRLNCG